MKTKLSLILAFALATSLTLQAATVRIVQTNAAGDSVMLIDPVTNKVVGEIGGIEVNHGAAAAPDGSRLYVTNEAESTLDVADLKTLKVVKSIPLTNHPNNVAVSKDGKRVYVAIVAGAGAIDVIDTGTLTDRPSGSSSSSPASTASPRSISRRTCSARRSSCPSCRRPNG